jgi:hypothetical protein
MYGFWFAEIPLAALLAAFTTNPITKQFHFLSTMLPSNFLYFLFKFGFVSINATICLNVSSDVVNL